MQERTPGFGRETGRGTKDRKEDWESLVTNDGGQRQAASNKRAKPNWRGKRLLRRKTRQEGFA